MLTIAEAAAFFLAAAARTPEVMSGVVAGVVAEGADRAKALIGHDHEDWAPLSSATLLGFRHYSGVFIPGKIELGYSPPDNPLLRSGQMRDSIEFVVEGTVGEVGSNDKRALYQELGTPSATYPTPPRPFLSKGLIEAAETVFEPLMLEAMTSLLVP